MRIEVGYGLEGVLTDVTSRRIIAENVAPLFRKGKFAAGINAGVDRIIAVVGERQAAAGADAAAQARRRRGDFDFGTLLIVLFIAVPIVGGILRSIFGKVGGFDWSAAASSARSHGSSPARSLIAGVAAVIGFIVMLFTGIGGTVGGRGGIFIPGGGGGFGGGGFGGGGGGFRGGGGSFGGGGASGGW